jgi:hypothetical protein
MTRTWAARIREARKRGTFTVEDQLDAANWNRCAVGERADWRNKSKVFSDPGDAITILGIEFCAAVFSNQIDEADRLLKSIHRVMRGEDP